MWCVIKRVDHKLWAWRRFECCGDENFLRFLFFLIVRVASNTNTRRSVLPRPLRRSVVTQSQHSWVIKVNLKAESERRSKQINQKQTLDDDSNHLWLRFKLVNLRSFHKSKKTRWQSEEKNVREKRGKLNKQVEINFPSKTVWHPVCVNTSRRFGDLEPRRCQKVFIWSKSLLSSAGASDSKQKKI